MKTRFLRLKTLTLILGLGLSVGASAQTQIVNSGFEEWENVGTTNEEPENWNSFMSANCTMSSFFCGQGQKKRIERSTDAHSGSYSARIWSTAVLGIVANGNMTLGRVHMGSTSASNSSNYNYTDINDSQFNQPLTDKPDSLVAWIKFNPKNGSHLGRVAATIHDAYNYRDPEDGNAAPHVVAKAEFDYPSTNEEWDRISIPFDYENQPSTDAQYILITFTTSNTPGGGSANDEVYIDDVELIYNDPLSVTPLLAQNLLVNQNGTTITAIETATAAYPSGTSDSRQWKYSTTPGGPYTNVIAGETGLTYTPQFAAVGTYYVVCEADFDGTTFTSEEVEINVEELSVSIAPLLTQNLVENQLGTELFATESHVADSREWKYSTTSGSGYVSFNTPETGNSYTPVFEDAGTYYVIYETEVYGNTVTSAEVEIIVTEFTVSVAPADIQNLIENQLGTELFATESHVAGSREWKYSTTSGSGYVSFNTPETGNSYTPVFEDAGTYYVIYEAEAYGNTAISAEVEIIVTEFTVSITPADIQNLETNEAGTELSVTESSTADSREWMYSTISGSGYISFDTPITGTSYTPLFITAGTYYVVCTSTIDNITITSNEIEINVEDAIEPSISITPNSTQNLIKNQVGNTISANEAPIAADSREWKYSTTSGSGYVSFTTPETGISYTPVFEDAGTYYVICEADFEGNIKTSNEITIVVNEFTNSIAPATTQTLLETQEGDVITVTETPEADSREWKFSTTSGSGYTSFATAETGTTYIPAFDDAGTYYVVVESTIDGITITSEEVEINVIEFLSSITPSSTQTLIETQVGDAITVTETPEADSREWKFSTTSGSGYTSFATAETGTTYTPAFDDAGTYYVVVESTIDGITITSEEVEINVIEFLSSITPSSTQTLIETQVGDAITVTETPEADSREWKYSTTSGSGYTSFATAETGTTYTPAFDDAGTYYIVVESTIDGITITSEEVGVEVVEFVVTIAPNETQTLLEGEEGDDLTVTETPEADSREWKYSTTSGSGYTSFATAETGTTYTPVFEDAGTYYVVVESTIAGITSTSNEVTIIVEEDTSVGIDNHKASNIHVYGVEKSVKVDLTNSSIENATIQVLSLGGQVVAKSSLDSSLINTISVNVEKGIYIYVISNGKQEATGKIYIY